MFNIQNSNTYDGGRHLNHGIGDRITGQIDQQKFGADALMCNAGKAKGERTGKVKIKIKNELYCGRVTVSMEKCLLRQQVCFRCPSTLPFILTPVCS